MNDIALNYARCFCSGAGKSVLEHLRQTTIERPIGSNATDNELRWLAAQSALVRHIESLVSQGRGRSNV